MSTTEEITAPIIGVAVTNACVIAGLAVTPIVAAICGNGAETVGFVIKGLAIAVPLEAACLTALWALRRNRPIRAEHSQGPSESVTEAAPTTG